MVGHFGRLLHEARGVRRWLLGLRLSFVLRRLGWNKLIEAVPLQQVQLLLLGFVLLELDVRKGHVEGAGAR